MYVVAVPAIEKSSQMPTVLDGTGREGSRVVTKCIDCKQTVPGLVPSHCQ